MDFVELKCRTNFSFLTGASHPEELVYRALEIGLKGLAITDKDGVYGMPKAYNIAKNNPEFKFIVGTDVALEGHSRLTLLARTRKAYGLMCRLITQSHAGREKGDALLLWKDFEAFMAEPFAADLLALPDDSAMTRYDLLRDLFGDRLYIPLSRFLDGRDRERTERALLLKRRYGSQVVATNDVHYHIRERRPLQDVMTSIRLTTPLQKAGYHLFSNDEHYLKSGEQMAALFSDLPEAVSNTMRVAEQCTFSPGELRYRYPSEWIPEQHTAQSYLEELTWKGAAKRFPEGASNEVVKQIHHEFDLIRKLGFADYFLTIYDIVEFAVSQKILCQGRGSAANSVVCYCLGITAINPLKINLLFERFISAERGEPPDIDVDFEHERREEVIRYIYDKYGRHRAAMVSAVVTYQTRSALREISKALGLDVGTLSAKEVNRNLDKMALEAGVPQAAAIVADLSEEIEGFPRHLSIHSGGFTLSADPITEIVPVEPARMEGRTIIQWDKYDLDYLNLLKVDVLSLGMLSALRKMLHLVGKELYEIPQDDPPTYAMIQKCDTVGTFQIESRAQMSMLGRLKPATFYDLVIEVAIVRPGPTQGGMVHPYLKRRQGLEEVNYYGDERVKKILEKTLGVPLFQEQVMQMAITLGGFTPGEADELRRAINAWRSSGSMDRLGRKLMQGLMKSGLPREFAERIFLQIQGFSSYGFPESHAASFALLAYASSYLKCHHMAEFTCSLVNSQPMGFYAPHTLIDDAKRHGVQILPVDPNISQWDCAIENKGIRLGLRVVSGLNEKVAEKIISEAKARKFSSLDEFLARTSLRQDVLHRLAMADAFTSFGYDRRHTLWQMLECEILLSEKDGAQGNLFKQASPFKSKDGIFKDLTAFEKIKSDYDAFNLSAHGHPMTVLRKNNSRLSQMTTAQAKEKKRGDTVKIAGLILVRQRPPTAKGVVFSTLEDEQGYLDLIFHPDVFEKYYDAFLNSCFIEVKGLLQKEQNSTSLLVKEVYALRESLYIDPHQYFIAL